MNNLIQDSESSKGQLAMGTLMGLDFGARKIGIALADGETKIAFGYRTIENNRETFNALAKIARDHDVNLVVIGFPTHDAHRHEAKQEKELFARHAEELLGVPVIFAEEMFTSLMAQQNLRQAGKKKVSAIDDSEAARIILQDWIDNKFDSYFS